MKGCHVQKMSSRSEKELAGKQFIRKSSFASKTEGFIVLILGFSEIRIVVGKRQDWT